MSNPAATVICFGEILWDFLPRGLFPGGAPHNVAYHLHQLGLRACLVSAVGHDLLGDELLRRLYHWNLPLDGVARHHGLSTGYVKATLGATGDACYEIATDVAWDRIPIEENILRTAAQARALVFGSLSLRTTYNRASLARLLDALPAEALRVFDVNLRPPYDDLPLVREIAKRATLLKLNDAEAARLTDNSPGSGREENRARLLAARTGCPAVCITAGERGAGLLSGGVWHWAAGRAVQVRDTVGAGDAFLAGLLAGLLRHRELAADALARACRLGEFVTAHDGATPPYRCDSQGYPLPENSAH